MMQFLPLPMYAIADQGESQGMPSKSNPREGAAHPFDFGSFFNAGFAGTLTSQSAQPKEVDAEEAEVISDDPAETDLDSKAEPEQSVNDTKEAHGTKQAASSHEPFIPDDGPDDGLDASSVAAATSLDAAVLLRFDAHGPVSAENVSQNLASGPASQDMAGSGREVNGHTAPKTSAYGEPLFKTAAPHPNSEAAAIEVRSGHVPNDPHLSSEKSLNLGVQAALDQGFRAAKPLQKAAARADTTDATKAQLQGVSNAIAVKASSQVEPEALMSVVKTENIAQASQGTQTSLQSNAASTSVAKGLGQDAVAGLPARRDKEKEERIPLHSLSSDDAKLTQQARRPFVTGAAQAPVMPAQTGFEPQQFKDDKGEVSVSSRDEAGRAGELFDTNVLRGAPPQSGVVTPSATLSEARAVLIVREAMAEMRANGQSEIELTLAPKELGKLRFVMSPSEGQMIVQVFAERQETLDAMRRHVEAYANALSAEGFGAAQFEFGRDTSGSAADPGTTGHENDAGADMQHAELSSQASLETARVVWLGSNKQLDIRL